MAKNPNTSSGRLSALVHPAHGWVQGIRANLTDKSYLQPVGQLGAIASVPIKWVRAVAEPEMPGTSAAHALQRVHLTVIRTPPTLMILECAKATVPAGRHHFVFDHATGSTGEVRSRNSD